MYNNILVPLDGSKLAECVLPHVKAIVDGCQPKSINFVRVVEAIYIPSTPDGMVDPKVLEEIEGQAIADAETYLRQLKNRLKYDGLKISSAVLQGSTTDAILTFISKNNIDLVIMATHGRSGVSRWLLGSIADRLLHTSPAPILLIRPKECLNVHNAGG